MLDTYSLESTATAVSRLRGALGATQAAVAQKAGLDQSRISRIEKGEVAAEPDVDRVLEALIALGSPHAAEFKDFRAREWAYVEPPSFWNPQRASLEIAEETLGKVHAFLDEDRPWPLKRQIERYRDALMRGASYLNKMTHQIAFVGDIGVGKSTALSFLFDLLVPAAGKPIERPVLETGAGGTTICEVHIRQGPEFGISILPMSETELSELVADFCAAKWLIASDGPRDGSDAIGVSREAERAIRNMCGLVRRRGVGEDGKPNPDPVLEIARACTSEDEFRTNVLERMALTDRTRREVWYDSATRQHPLEWLSKAFREVNNGRMQDVTLPKSIDLLIPEFGRAFGELQVAIIDTKGVDDVAVREDLDLRLKDPRTAVVLCARFNDAPGTTSKALLQHMRQTFSEPVNTGKVSIMALPRSGEARAMKDDTGDNALDDSEGYAFKRMQIEGELAADELSGVPMMFFNVDSDDAGQARGALFLQLDRMRNAMADRLFDLCAAVDELIDNHEAHGLNAAIEEVAARLNTFLRANGKLGARERNAYVEAIQTMSSVRYAATLWAATRRSGEYSGLNVVHQVGVGAARDARLRSDGWFRSLKDFLAALKADEGLQLATRTIDQIGKSAISSRTTFLEAVQRGGMEVYREPLTQSPVWSKCAREWGAGPGFKGRVVYQLEQWFESEQGLKDTLEEIANTLWEQLVVAPLLRQVAQEAPQTSNSNVVEFPSRASLPR